MIELRFKKVTSVRLYVSLVSKSKSVLAIQLSGSLETESDKEPGFSGEGVLTQGHLLIS